MKTMKDKPYMRACMIAVYIAKLIQEIEKHLKKKTKTSFFKMPFFKMPYNYTLGAVYKSAKL